MQLFLVGPESELWDLSLLSILKKNFKSSISNLINLRKTILERSFGVSESFSYLMQINLICSIINVKFGMNHQCLRALLTSS